jgi:hypothetical protein
MGAVTDTGSEEDTQGQMRLFFSRYSQERLEPWLIPCL